MKKLIRTIILPLCLSSVLNAQNHLEVEGKTKIAKMEKVNTADSVVVRLGDGTLAVRDASTLSVDQIISISNDTIFLSNGGFIGLPVEVDGSVANELQTISRSGLTVSLTDGGTYQDSVNVYTAGTGISITNQVISTSSIVSPRYLGKDTLAESFIIFTRAVMARIMA
ncbi:MAG: hypothetical protein IPL46_21475 [Saprospiraceae bacterium]|nr:hypothetical protein [Saprospiraceae bacterium]